MRGRRNENPRKAKNRHQQQAVHMPGKHRDPDVHNERGAPGRQEKPFKGMDMDKVNYTDL